MSHSTVGPGCPIISPFPPNKCKDWLLTVCYTDCDNAIQNGNTPAASGCNMMCAGPCLVSVPPSLGLRLIILPRRRDSDVRRRLQTQRLQINKTTPVRTRFVQRMGIPRLLYVRILFHSAPNSNTINYNETITPRRTLMLASPDLRDISFRFDPSFRFTNAPPTIQ